MFSSSRRSLLKSGAAFFALGTLPAATAKALAMSHIVLLGDSVFDNGAYTAGGPDVVRQLKSQLPETTSGTLLAKDGAVIANISGQLERLPSDASHIVVSVGGNDGLRSVGLLSETVTSVAQALEKLEAFREKFRSDYRKMLSQVMEKGRPVAVCTIYDPRYPDPAKRLHATSALVMLNDIIIREAAQQKASVIDLRIVCDKDEDFANPIEPSSIGGEKIVRAILNFASGKSSMGMITG